MAIPMKQPRHLAARIACLLSACCLAACQSPQPAGVVSSTATATAQPGPPMAPAHRSAPTPPALAQQPREEARPSCRTCPHERDPLLDPSSPLAKREIFFGLDQFQLAPEAQALLDHHAKYLASRPKRRLRLEGHADQRGGSEFNLALGQMRAQSVARMLMLLGVREAQLDTVSFGEERPRVSGDNEAAWQHNRRVDLVYEP